MSTDPDDGTDDSNILDTPYPPSDPNLWDRDEYWATIPFNPPNRRPKAFQPDRDTHGGEA